MKANLLTIVQECPKGQILWSNPVSDMFSFLSRREELSFMQRKDFEILKTIYEQCHEINWDGEDAEAISYETYDSAFLVLKVLFNNRIHIDNIAPASDGSIGLNLDTPIYSIFIHVKDREVVYTRVEHKNPSDTLILACKTWEFSKNIQTIRNDYEAG